MEASVINYPDLLVTKQLDGKNIWTARTQKGNRWLATWPDIINRQTLMFRCAESAGLTIRVKS